VRVGGTQRTVAGVLEVLAVDRVAVEDITEDDARQAGVRSRERLLRLLDRRPGAHVWRMRVRGAGADPRVALRAAADLGPADRAAIDGRLDRWDAASSEGPWTRRTLRMIAERPGVRAPDLAATVGRETPPFKRDVRKLKELGLTESLEVGYRISPRGAAYLAGLPGRESSA
jgi:hypothetical protein